MNIEQEVTARVKSIMGDMQFQLIVTTINLEAAQARIKELEAVAKEK